ncbi:MAG: ribosome recycling factor [Bacteroidetes bacterium]|nr:MAG: ribosome recycling factor [Bacteroidota bacterium]
MDELVQMVLTDAEEQMQKSIRHLEYELVKIRAGKANPTMLQGVKVEYYGTPTPLEQVANISTLDPYTLAVKPWEKNMIKPIEKAIMEANLGLNPDSDAEMVRIPIPRLTEERRKLLVKQANAEGENAKIAIRGIRRNSNSELKKLEKEEGISEDIIKQAEQKVQDLTKKYEGIINDMLQKKEQDIMTV